MEPFKIGWMMINDPYNGERIQQLAFTISLNRFVVLMWVFGCLKMYIYIFSMLQSVFGIRFRIDGFARERGYSIWLV